MGSPDTEFYVREISREIDEQVNSVRRELSNLQDVDIVKSTTSDRKIFYSINKNHDLYVPLHLMFMGGGAPVVAKGELSLDGEWGQKIAKIAEFVDIFVTSGKIVGEDKSPVDMILVGDNRGGDISKWAGDVERDFEGGLRYSIMTPEEFYYRYSTRDIFVGGVFDNNH